MSYSTLLPENCTQKQHPSLQRLCLPSALKMFCQTHSGGEPKASYTKAAVVSTDWAAPVSLPIFLPLTLRLPHGINKQIHNTNICCASVLCWSWKGLAIACPLYRDPWTRRNEAVTQTVSPESFTAAFDTQDPFFPGVNTEGSPYSYPQRERCIDP